MANATEYAGGNHGSQVPVTMYYGGGCSFNGSVLDSRDPTSATFVYHQGLC